MNTGASFLRIYICQQIVYLGKIGIWSATCEDKSATLLQLEIDVVFSVGEMRKSNRSVDLKATGIAVLYLKWPKT